MSDGILAAERPKLYELQITSSELYAFEPLLCDAVYHLTQEISDLRKKLGIPSEYPNQTEMLVDIQCAEGRKAILEDLLSQLSEQGL